MVKLKICLKNCIESRVPKQECLCYKFSAQNWLPKDIILPELSHEDMCPLQSWSKGDLGYSSDKQYLVAKFIWFQFCRHIKYKVMQTYASVSEEVRQHAAESDSWQEEPMRPLY